MTNQNMEILKMRILIALLKMSSESSTVTNLAKTFAIEKYTISRAMATLEKEGYLDRTNLRKPILTAAGEEKAFIYASHVDIATNHFIHEGVSEQQAKNDAMFIALYCSEETIHVIQDIEGRIQAKEQLVKRKQFDGAELCKKMRDGNYSFPFMFYREKVKDGNNISMANEGFSHPCTMNIQGGVGVVCLKAKSISRTSSFTNKKMMGKIDKIKYFDGHQYCDAEKNGDLITFPAEMLQFINVGNSEEGMFYGSVSMKMKCTVGALHMPESTALFTIII